MQPLKTEAARLYGTVTDKNQNPLTFATLYIKNTSNGTTTNAEGKYSLELTPGHYEIIFQFVGYVKATRFIDIGDTDMMLDVVLEEEVIKLDEVIVNANGEDPAYAVIREAIKKRKYYLNEVDGFDCEVYIKGLQRLDEKPEKLFGQTITIDTGIVYLSESISNFSFQRPNKIKEQMISSKVSGRNNAFSFNQASEMMFSFYENIINIVGISERGFISPIANNALMFYEYKLEGTFNEGDQLINKIKVIPKRKSDPVFTGHIYIIENSWRIHSVDLLLTKANQIEFVDSLGVNQVYAPVKDDLWMVLSQKFDFIFNAFGFKGSGYYISVHADYDIDLQREKKFFNNEIMFVEKSANERDSAYWQKIRPVPLTNLEARDYMIKDSVAVIKDSKAYKDSVDRESNQLSLGNLLLGGYTIRNSHERKYLTFDALPEIVYFNTVEGFALNMNVRYLKRYDDNKFLSITPSFRYGFSNKKFYGQLVATYRYNPINQGYFTISGGKYIRQLDPSNPILSFPNSFHSLFLGNNYMKLYETAYFSIKHNYEIINGIMLSAILEYEDRAQLNNTTDFKFIDKENKEYTSNQPANINLEDTSFPDHQAFIFDLNLRLRIGQKYISRPNRKIRLESPFPTINFNYRKGIKSVLGSDVDFDKVEIAIDDELSLGLLGTGRFQVALGSFLNNESDFFLDYQHFNGQRTYYSTFESRAFQLLDYYFYSTNSDYFMANYNHHFNGFIINKLPLLRKSKAQVVGSFNFLKTRELDHYFEIGIGLEHIFKFMRVDYFFGILGSEGQQTMHGIRYGFGF